MVELLRTVVSGVTFIMTRRSCAIYGVGIVCASLLVIGISLTVAQVFQTLIHNRLKKVNVFIIQKLSHFVFLYFLCYNNVLSHEMFSFIGLQLQWKSYL